MLVSKTDTVSLMSNDRWAETQSTAFANSVELPVTGRPQCAQLFSSESPSHRDWCLSEAKEENEEGGGGSSHRDKALTHQGDAIERVNESQRVASQRVL